MLINFLTCIAEIAFREVGETLRRRRQYDLYDIHLGYFDEMKDPADSDPELNAMLENNRKEYSKKIEEVSLLLFFRFGRFVLFFIVFILCLDNDDVCQ